MFHQVLLSTGMLYQTGAYVWRYPLCTGCSLFPPRPTAWPQHYFLRGHTGRVTCLLYPRNYSKAYDDNFLLSGSADFSVKLWNLYNGVVVHTFAVHGGVVKRILACPPDINVRYMQTK